MQVDQLDQLRLRKTKIFDIFLQIAGRKFVIVFFDKIQTLGAAHMTVLDLPRRVADRAPEAELDELHIVVKIVDLIIEAVEVGKRAVGAPLRIGHKIDLGADELVVFAERLQKKVPETTLPYAHSPIGLDRRPNARSSVVIGGPG